MVLPEPDDNHGNDPQGAVALGPLVIASGDGPELLAAGEAVLDLVAQPVGGAVEGTTAVLVASMGDGVADAVAAAQRPDSAAAIALVAHDPLRAHAGAAAFRATDGAGGEQPGEDRRLVALPRRAHYGQWLTAALRLEMDLGREAPLAAAERFGGRVPPFAPAACWWARTTEPSTNCSSQSTRPAESSWRWSAANSRSHTPANRQRRKRVYTLCQGPYRSGRSRHGAPVPSRHRMPFTTDRWSLF